MVPFILQRGSIDVPLPPHEVRFVRIEPRRPDVEEPRLSLDVLLEPYGTFERLPVRWPAAGSHTTPPSSQGAAGSVGLHSSGVVKLLDQLAQTEP